MFQSRSDLARISMKSKLKFDSYGSRERNLIVWSPPSVRNVIFLWIHGGYWQGSSIEEALIGANNVVDQGFGYAAIDYTLSPEISIGGIIDECVGAVLWLRQRNKGAVIILGGHSAGSHLAMSVAVRIQIDGLVLVSGIYDLRPIVQTTINDALGLTPSEALLLSPIAGAFPFPCATEVLVGGDESPSFHEQARAVTEYLTDNHAAVCANTIKGLDHFDIIVNGEHLKSFFRLANS